MKLERIYFPTKTKHSQIFDGPAKESAAKLVETQRLVFNQRLDAAVTMVLASMVLVLIVEAVIQWSAILSRRHTPVLHESPYVATQWAPGFSGVAHGDD